MELAQAVETILMHNPGPRAGFVLVKKVPGTLHFGARSEGHSFDHVFMNMTHVVHSLYFGSRWVGPEREEDDVLQGPR